MRVLNTINSIANTYLAELRNVEVQNDRLRFRTNLQRLGTLMAYEISKTLHFEKQKIQTPLAITAEQTISDSIVLVSILRAAVPFMNGFLDVFDHSEVGFIGAWRKEETENIEVALEYSAAPNLEGKTLILIDPMLATGKSLVASLNQILKNGKPAGIYLASVIAAPEGIEYLKRNIEVDHELWIWAVDEKLNDKSYIVPGLGDAGDLSFGSKL
ncbi:uracil phosphoribosyltransferase [Roseivirga seohaensis subsp. aquiponti]|uniref:Uracil phosphoribosyltransferase n=1 Tax=Roseivirga seohaensis subsp. aquiponti TaxID=1566026 RepID=A0A0L8AJU4_9BACT|nr:uracil phosphoribosyltransferase [Roseivirga seohaensis]KOF02506.1 uracil phosphoribosyltransferase [Roseivirga seohaensis subsp. aquiponti]